MIDTTDFIVKRYKSKQRKDGYANTKIYRHICDVCGEKIRYASKDKKKHYCKKCQYEKLSKQFSKPRILGECGVCGKAISRVESQWKKAKLPTCSNICTGIAKRKDITEVQRCYLKEKMLQAGVKTECVTCGTNHLWNLQAHHIVFVSNGGTNELSNLELQCRNCHADIHYYYGKDNKE